MKTLLTSLVVLSVFLTGCLDPTMLIAPIVSGVVIWKQGEAQKYYENGQNRTFKATCQALTDMNIPYEIISSSEINANKDRFKIQVVEVKPNITVVKIRIGFLGDKPYAELIYKSIDKNIPIIEYSKEKPKRFFKNRNRIR